MKIIVFSVCFYAALLHFLNFQMKEKIARQEKKIESLQQSAFKSVFPAVDDYCKDKGGDPFLVINGSKGLLSCAHGGSLKLFIQSEE